MLITMNTTDSDKFCVEISKVEAKHSVRKIYYTVTEMIDQMLRPYRGLESIFRLSDTNIKRLKFKF